ncbi:hypothetical protein Emag_002947 [Eimeria magna]
MAELYAGLEEVPTYYDKRTCSSLEEWNEAVRTSRAVYVGNLNYFTTEEELYEETELELIRVYAQLASHAGSVDRIVMGLNRLTRAPCGFAFVFFRSSQEAHVAVEILSGAQCDGRVIRVDPDSGRDIDGDRKFGRDEFPLRLTRRDFCCFASVSCARVLRVACEGTSGRQWRDEWRDFYDPGRGGEGGEPGKRAREEFEASLMASHLMPANHAGGFPRNVRQRWASGGGGPPRVPPPPFPGPLPPADWGPPPLRAHPQSENPFAYNKKFARGRRP